MIELVTYRVLGKIDFALSRFAAFGLWKPERIILPRRPLRRLFFLGRAQLRCLHMEIMTGRKASERGAVSATVRYFTVFGRELTAEQKFVHQSFFADEASQLSPQYLWVKKPKGAAFALVELARTLNQSRIGFAGRIKLISVREGDVEPVDIDTCRDRTRLEISLEQAYLRADRDAGRQLLCRLIFVWQAVEYQQALAVLNDAEQLLKFGFSTRFSTDFVQNNGVSFEYGALFSGTMPRDMPILKWLKHEAALLEQALQHEAAAEIKIIQGDNLMVRSLVGKAAATACGLEFVLEAPMVDKENSNVGWLNVNELSDL